VTVKTVRLSKAMMAIMEVVVQLHHGRGHGHGCALVPVLVLF
jgi:hypothetical protein